MSKPALQIGEPRTGVSNLCEPILRALPRWFSVEAAIQEYVEGINTLPTFLAMRHGEVVGFLTIKQNSASTAEIFLMAVRPELHHQGIGKVLVEYAEAFAVTKGGEYLQVKTVGPSRPNEAYEDTRRFLSAVGFRPLEEFETLWGECNPCLIMVKAVKQDGCVAGGIR